MKVTIHIDDEQSEEIVKKHLLETLAIFAEDYAQYPDPETASDINAIERVLEIYGWH